MTIKYTHTVGPSGLSAYFPEPTVTEATWEQDGWPQNTVRVDWDHEENCYCAVLSDGTSYTMDSALQMLYDGAFISGRNTYEAAINKQRFMPIKDKD